MISSRDSYFGRVMEVEDQQVQDQTNDIKIEQTGPQIICGQTYCSIQILNNSDHMLELAQIVKCRG